MRRRTVRRALLTALVILLAVSGLTACSDDDPPDWLVDRAASSTTSPPSTTEAPASTTVVQPGQELAAIELQVGQCIEDASEFTGRQVNEITRTRTIPCRMPHAAEVYLRDRLAGGPNAPFPGIGELRGQAQALCREGFERFVGVRWTQSELDIAALWPSPDSWPTGDRLVVCVIFRVDGQPLTGTARGSRL
jgi:hypothetical protein